MAKEIEKKYSFLDRLTGIDELTEKGLEENPDFGKRVKPVKTMAEEASRIKDIFTNKETVPKYEENQIKLSKKAVEKIVKKVVGNSDEPTL